MQAKDDVWIGRAIWFLITMAAIAKWTPFGAYAFPLAGALFVVAWLAARLIGQAVTHLEFRAYGLVLQLAAWFGLFLWLAPFETTRNVLVVWGLGLPLLLVGAVSRGIYDRLVWVRPALRRIPPVLCATTAVAVPVTLGAEGAAGYAGGALLGAVLCALAAIPLYYGWRLADRPPRDDRDARFGTEDDFRARGTSDDL